MNIVHSTVTKFVDFVTHKTHKKEEESKLQFSYDTMTQRHPTKADLDKRVAAVSKEKVTFQAHSLNSEISQECFTDPSFPWEVLATFKQHKITHTQCATGLMFADAFKHHEKDEVQPLVMPLFGDFAKFNQELLRSTGFFVTDSGMYHYFNGEKWEKFLKLVQQLPKSEQVFLLALEKEKKQKAPTFVDVISQNGFNLLNKVNISSYTLGDLAKEVKAINKGQVPQALQQPLTMQMIPSFGMMQACHTALTGREATLEPVLGECRDEEIRLDGHKRVRKVGIQFPASRQPDRADGVLAPSYQFTLHDGMYHGLLVSETPPEICALQLEIADWLEKLEGKGIPGISRLVNVFADMDNVQFAPHWLVATREAELENFPELEDDDVLLATSFWRCLNKFFYFIGEYVKVELHESYTFESRHMLLNHLAEFFVTKLESNRYPLLKGLEIQAAIDDRDVAMCRKLHKEGEISTEGVQRFVFGRPSCEIYRLYQAQVKKNKKDT